MRKIFLTVILLSFAVFLINSATLASESNKGAFINLYQADNSLGVGFKGKMLWNFYGSVNLEYYEAQKDLKIQGGLVYLFPHDVLFFKLYGGAGREYYRDNGFNYNYIMMGTHFLFGFAEVLYPWETQAAPIYRYGVSLNF